jgi:hypothetical protein
MIRLSLALSCLSGLWVLYNPSLQWWAVPTAALSLVALAGAE